MPSLHVPVLKHAYFLIFGKGTWVQFSSNQSFVKFCYSTNSKNAISALYNANIMAVALFLAKRIECLLNFLIGRVDNSHRPNDLLLAKHNIEVC